MRLTGRFRPIRTGDESLDSALERWRVTLELMSGATWNGGSGISPHDHPDLVADLVALVTDLVADLVALGGRSGGQSVCGGTGGEENLVLQSTSDSVRGVVSVVDDLVTQGRLRASVSGPELLKKDKNDHPCGGHGVLLLKTDASRVVTGLAGATDSQFLLVVNVGANDLVIAHDNTGSTDVNRIITGPLGADLTVPPNGNVTLWYDADQSRWRVVGVHV